jgi:hypothetical protein
MTPRSPLEEKEKTNKIMKIVVEIIKTLEVECAHIYTKTMGVYWA